MPKLALVNPFHPTRNSLLKNIDIPYPIICLAEKLSLFFLPRNGAASESKYAQGFSISLACIKLLRFAFHALGSGSCCVLGPCGILFDLEEPMTIDAAHLAESSKGLTPLHYTVSRSATIQGNAARLPVSEINF